MGTENVPRQEPGLWHSQSRRSTARSQPTNLTSWQIAAASVSSSLHPARNSGASVLSMRFSQNVSRLEICGPIDLPVAGYVSRKRMRTRFAPNRPGAAPEPRVGIGRQRWRQAVEVAGDGDLAKRTYDDLSGQPALRRPNQIQIHPASIGHPGLGDPLYGSDGRPLSHLPGLPGFGGYLPHEHFLRFPHPISREQIIVEATLPPGL